MKNKCINLGMLQGDKWDKLHDESRRVYSDEGASPSLVCTGGGNHEIKIAECVGGISENKWIAANRGRNPDNPSDREKRSNLAQRLELNSSEHTNAITTVQKDNYAVEPINPMPNGTCRTIKAQYQNSSAANFASSGTFGATGVAIKTANSAGYDVAEDGDSINLSYPDSETRRGRVGHSKAQTIMCNDSQGIVVLGNRYESGHEAGRIVGDGGVSPTVKENHGTVTSVQHNYRIRKLTERECFKLMGVKQKDFERVARHQPQSSLYHLAGDSIVTTCLVALFGEMFDVDYKQKINEVVEDITND